MQSLTLPRSGGKSILETRYNILPSGPDSPSIGPLWVCTNRPNGASLPGDLIPTFIGIEVNLSWLKILILSGSKVRPKPSSLSCMKKFSWSRGRIKSQIGCPLGYSISSPNSCGSEPLGSKIYTFNLFYVKISFIAWNFWWPQLTRAGSHRK